MVMAFIGVLVFSLFTPVCVAQHQAGPAIRNVHDQEGCRTVLVDGRAARACVYGSGAPTVVLAAGAGLTSQTWSGIAPALASFSTVVTFDRAGLGRSDPGPLPRTPTQIASELFALLNQLEIDGPLVLVGHSMGGLHMLRFAEQYPSDVANIVLLDTPPKHFEELRLGLLTEQERQARTGTLRMGLEDSPDVIRLEREGAASDDVWDSEPLGVEVSRGCVFCAKPADAPMCRPLPGGSG